MACRTFRRRLLINSHQLVIDHARLYVTFRAWNVGMASLQREMRLRIMVKGRRDPALRIMAVRAMGVAFLRKLAVMHIPVTTLTKLRCSLELHFLCADGHLVTSATFDGAVRTQQRELRFRMVEAIHICPGPHVVAGFASERRPIGPELCHAILEFAVVRIRVARGAALILEMKRQNLVRSARRAHLMTIRAGHGCMRSRQSKTGVAMLGDSECGSVEVLDRVTAFTFVLIRRRGKLPIVCVLVAIGASRKLHFINRVLACRQMALGAFDGDMLPFQRVIRGVVFLHPEE